MKIQKKYLLLSLVVTGVFANANSGAYLGLEVGAANQSINFNQSAFNLNTSNSSVLNSQWNGIGRIYSGYNFNRYTGLEAGVSYTMPTGYSYPDNNGSFFSPATVVDVSYVPMLPIAYSNWSVFGRIGVGYAWLPDGSSSQYNSSGSNLTDVLGAGLRYKFSNHWTYKIEWVADGLLFPVGINSGSTNIGAWSQQTFQTGVSFHF